MKWYFVPVLVLSIAPVAAMSQQRSINAIEINHTAGRVQGGFRISYTVTNLTEADLCIPEGALTDEEQYSSIAMLRAIDQNGADIPHPSYGMPCDVVSKDLCQPVHVVKLSPNESLESSLAVSGDYFNTDIRKVQLSLFAIPNCSFIDSNGYLPVQFTLLGTVENNQMIWLELVSEEAAFALKN